MQDYNNRRWSSRHRRPSPRIYRYNPKPKPRYTLRRLAGDALAFLAMAAIMAQALFWYWILTD